MAEHLNDKDEAVPSYQFDFTALTVGHCGVDDDESSQHSLFSSDESCGDGLPRNELSRLIAENDWEEALSKIFKEKDDASGAANNTSLARTPEKGGKRQFRGMLPLHFACREGAPPDVIQALVDLYPEGMLVRVEESGWTALHYVAGAGREGGEGLNGRMCHETLDDDDCKNDDGGYPLCSAECMLCNDTCNRVSAVRILLSSSNSSPSAMIRTTDHDGGLTPLHVACLNEAEPDLLNTLLDADPEVVSISDDDDNLPLHWMFHPHVSIELVQRMVREHPNGTQAVNSNGALPLHRACTAGSPVEVIRFLLLQYPHGSQVADENGNLPLHVIIPKCCRDDEGSNNQTNRQQNHSKDRMLQAQVQSLQELLATYPDGVHVKNKYGETPLDRALSEEATLDFVQPLLDASPDCCFENNNMVLKVGRVGSKGACDNKSNSAGNDATTAISTPLHVACKYNAPVDVIHALLKTNPKQARRISLDGPGGDHLPLHAACRTGASVDTIKALLRSYPEGAAMPDGNHRRNSLHLECMTRCHPDVIRMLLDAYKASAGATDLRGRTALHYAAENSIVVENGSREAVTILLEAFPKAMEVRDNDGCVPCLKKLMNTEEDSGSTFEKGRNDEDADEDSASDRKRSVRFA